MDYRLQQAQRAYYQHPTLENRIRYYRLKRMARLSGLELPLEVIVLHTSWVNSDIFLRMARRFCRLLKMEL